MSVSAEVVQRNFVVCFRESIRVRMITDVKKDLRYDRVVLKVKL